MTYVFLPGGSSVDMDAVVAIDRSDVKIATIHLRSGQSFKMQNDAAGKLEYYLGQRQAGPFA